MPQIYNWIPQMTGHSLLIVGQFHDNFSAAMSPGDSYATRTPSPNTKVRNCAFVSYLLGRGSCAIGFPIEGPSMSCIQLRATHKDTGQDISIVVQAIGESCDTSASFGPKAIFVFRVSDTFGQDSHCRWNTKANPHVYEAIYG